MKNARILIIDDDAEHTLLLAAKLKPKGYEVLSAPDAVFAVSIAKQERPDVILLDIEMPGGDGFLVLSRLKSILDLLTIPVIVITASIREDLKVKARKAGAVAFLSKPIDGQLLLGTVGKAVRMFDDDEMPPT